MKVILSRKGFDSSYGGQPSPILPDGTLLSLPIPARNDVFKFSDLRYQDKSYYEIIKKLKPNSKIKKDYTCHLDPDIRRDVVKRGPSWKGLFGQMGSAQGHLNNENVGLDDIFIFFGWFKETEYTHAGIQYIKNAPDLHVIFGYFQIGQIYKSYDDLPNLAKYHSHANKFSIDKNNCIYEAKESLSFNNRISGCGCLKYNKTLVLTKEGENKSHWDLPDYFKGVKISYHSINSFKQDYFDSAKKGQEFVIENNESIVEWTKNVIKNYDSSLL
ncbi:MAG: hypothetical protein KJ620_10255 [Candidatus Edwardsbacteria bacterium]|nr:hypothetical protein [Candidatus Edwardsbacteria bacterium]MBU1577445.1 hypothetical protein [Candidatus Edwardsbacteria bacterium]MBU2463221.1 hypothetical protein [Candidatus Edwardsbacteria bacterium]MBU2593012.1 hypothetical protein [Candidatus Edwardsbacteria bacterium]